jgi:hypothetical protein
MTAVFIAIASWPVVTLEHCAWFHVPASYDISHLLANFPALTLSIACDFADVWIRETEYTQRKLLPMRLQRST